MFSHITACSRRSRIQCWTALHHRQHLSPPARATRSARGFRRSQRLVGGAPKAPACGAAQLRRRLSQRDEVALPILRRLGIPAIVSTAACLVDSGRTIWSLEIDLLMLRGDLPTIEIPTNGERRRFSLQNDAARFRASQFARTTAWASGGDAPLQLVADLIGQFGDDRLARLLRDPRTCRSWARRN